LGDWILVQEGDETVFIGYDHLETISKILRYRKIKEKNQEFYQVVLDRTPFYAESGGQIGDTGYLEGSGKHYPVFNTRKENNLIVHFMKVLPDHPELNFRAIVDEGRRNAIQFNHSATHLLHAALRQVLGSHVQQKGSLVSESSLRFDFSHFTKMSDEEIDQVEKIVNKRIRSNIQLDERRNVPIDEAKKLGAMALFGEKYGDFVRVITFDPGYSVELCGGTHVKSTGSIGIFKIISEGSVAAGVRRIEAVSGETAERFINNQLKLLQEVNILLKSPRDTFKAIQSLIDERQNLAKEIETLHLQNLSGIKKELTQKIRMIGPVSVIVEQVKIPNADALKKLAFELKNERDQLFMVLAAEVGDKPQVAVMISDNIVQEYKLNAGQLVKELAREIGGGGGGQPFFATAGGKDVHGLPKVVEKALQLANHVFKTK
jgi:alanyl-tRNA synthetase